MNAKLIPAALFAMVASIAACDGNDDPATDVRVDTGSPDADATGETTADTTAPDIVTTAGSVKAAQVEAESVTCDPAGFVDVNPQASIQNVVVTTPKFDASPNEDGIIDGYYVADQDGGAYSGILLRVPAAVRPAVELVPGDVIDVTGQLKEVFCWTQIEVTTITAKSKVAAPSPLIVGNPPDIAGEAYESMLVTVKDVTIAAASANGGFKFTPGDIGIGFSFPGFIGLTIGQVYDITGVVRLNFNAYQLVPRGPADVVLKSVTTGGISDIQGSAISMTCANPDTQFVNGAAGIQLNGIVAVGNHYITGTLDGYVITDGTQDPYSGILVNISNTPKTTFQVGDEVRITGDHQEFYCNSQIRVSSMEKTGGPTALPAPVSLAKSPSAEDLEKHEGMLVEMTGIVAGAYNADKRAVTTDAGVDIDYGIMGPTEFDDGAAIAGKTATVRGIIRFSRGSYRISPRNAADMIPAP